MDNSKERHGCVTAWLVLMIVINAISAVGYLIGGIVLKNAALANVPTSILIILAICGVANVLFAILLFQWKRLGFWGFIGTSIIAFVVNISLGLGVGQSVLGLAGVAILYGILQIKKNEVTAWDNLE